MKRLVFFTGVILALVGVTAVEVRAGMILGWGETATPKSSLTNLTAVSAGAYHSIVLKSDGTIVGWGSNEFGQAAPSDGDNLIMMQSGEYLTTFSVTCVTISWFFLTRSSLDIPGFRGKPEVTTTISEFIVSA